MKLIKNFSLVFVSIALSLMMIEIILFFFYPQPKNGSWRVQNEDGVYINKDSGKSKHEFIGKKEKISLTYKFGKFNNRVIFDDFYSDREDKILVLGDSNVFGWLLEDKDTFIGKLQKFYENFYFVNSAAGGFSDSDTYLFLSRYCSKIQPKYILYFIDIDRSIRKKSIYINEQNQFVINKNKKNKVKEFLNDKTFFYFLLENFHIMQLVKSLYVNLSNEAYIDYVVKEDPNLKKIRKKINSITDNKTDEERNKLKKLKENIKIKEDFNLIKKLYKNIYKEVKNCNSKIIFVDLGWYNKTYNTDLYNLVVENFNTMFDTKNEIIFISLYQQMRVKKKIGESYKLEEGHPNEKGNEIIYQLLREKIRFYLK